MAKQYLEMFIESINRKWSKYRAEKSPDGALAYVRSPEGKNIVAVIWESDMGLESRILPAATIQDSATIHIEIGLALMGAFTQE